MWSKTEDETGGEARHRCFRDMLLFVNQAIFIHARREKNKISLSRKKSVRCFGDYVMVFSLNYSRALNTSDEEVMHFQQEKKRGRHFPFMSQGSYFLLRCD